MCWCGRWIAASRRLLTKRLMHTSVTPNQITLGSAAVGLMGAFFLAQPSQVWQVLGSLLFLLSTIMDGCDGEIARLTFQESAFGAKLDLIMDNIVHLVLFPSIALGLYRREYDTLYFVLGGLTLGGILVSIAVYLPYLLRRQKMHSTLARLYEHLASRDFAYVLPVLALIDRLQWFLWATTIGTYLFAGAWVVLAVRERRQQHGHGNEKSDFGVGMLSPAQHDGSGVDELATWRTRWRPRQVCVSQEEARSPNPSNRTTRKLVRRPVLPTCHTMPPSKSRPARKNT